MANRLAEDSLGKLALVDERGAAAKEQSWSPHKSDTSKLRLTMLLALQLR